MQIEEDVRARGGAAAARQASASLLSNAIQEPWLKAELCPPALNASQYKNVICITKAL